MKIKSVTGKQAGVDAPLVLGAVGGAMIGRGLTASISKPVDASAPTQKELDKKMYIQLGMVAAGAYGFMAIDGNDAVASASKGAALGIAVDNAISVVSSLVNKNETIKTKLAADTGTNRFLKASLGLACPCNSNVPSYQLNRPKRRALRMPEVMQVQALANPLDAIYDNAVANLY